MQISCYHSFMKFVDLLNNIFPHNCYSFNKLKNLQMSYGERWADFSHVMPNELSMLLYHLIKFENKDFSNIAFDEILQNMDGIYPEVLYKELMKRGIKIDYSDAKTGREKSDLPPEHIVNREWRFTNKSVEDIINRLDTKKKICCLGTPTVFKGLREKNINATYLDVNAPMVDYFKATDKSANCDVYDVQGKLEKGLLGKFDTVIIDPPWQFEYYKAFLIRSLQLLKNQGGNVFVALLELFSRNGAIKDMAEIQKFCEQANVKNIETSTWAKYDTPVFERNALLSAGSPLPTNDWRKTEIVNMAFDGNKKFFENEDLEMQKDNYIRQYDPATKKYLAHKNAISNNINPKAIMPSIKLSDLAKTNFKAIDESNLIYN